MKNPLFSNVYKYYKKKEAQYLQHANYIISLTEAGKREMMTWPSFRQDTPISVIPCCADMVHFSLTDADQKLAGRKGLNIASDALVVSYLGSIGTWYMLDEMLLFFKKLKEYYPVAKFLFITHSPRRVIELRIKDFGLASQDFIITEAARKDVPGMIKASDINISFIKPVYSKISSSPTKLGEVLSMGIPVIVNSGVGDVKQSIQEMDAGYVLEGFGPADYETAIKEIPYLLKKSPAAIRAAAERIYSLEKGIGAYLKCYKSVLS